MVEDLCPDCERDFSSIYPALARWYPNDRKALLTHLADPSIEWAYGKSPSSTGSAADADAWYARALRRTIPVLESSRWKWCYAPDKGHILVVPENAGAPPGPKGRPPLVLQTSAGVSLWRFLENQISDDPSWSSVTPSPPP